jgi:naringenin degradation protein FdeH
MKSSVGLAALLFASCAFAQQTLEVRRVVTKIDESGKAVVMIDERTALHRPRGPAYVGNLWVSESSPPGFSWSADRAKAKIGLMPPKGGSVFRVVDFPPEKEALEHMGKGTMQDVVGAAGTPAKGVPPRHPLMHRTRSLDYAIIMSGEIDMLLDEGEVHLKAGDVVVQQATNHAWVNRSGKPCRIAFILMDSQEP